MTGRLREAPGRAQREGPAVNLIGMKFRAFGSEGVEYRSHDFR